MVADPTPSVVFVYASNMKEQELSDASAFQSEKVTLSVTADTVRGQAR
jgi:hypothetical protein